MFTVELFLKAAAAIVSGAFALVVLSTGPRRTPQRFLAAFLFLISANQAADMMFTLSDDPAARAVWVRVGTVFAAVDPLVLYYFASIFPERNALHRTGPLAAVAAGSAFFAFAAPFTSPEGTGPIASRLLVTGLTVFTAVVYTTILVATVRGMLDHPDEPGWRPLVPAMAFAALPVWMRAIGQGEHTAWQILAPHTDPEPVAFIIPGRILQLAAIAVSVGAFALWTRRRTRDAPETRRFLDRTWLAAAALCLFLRSPDASGLAAALGLLDEPTGLTIGRVANSIRWLLFGGLVSVAILRHRLLAMTVAARRRAARVLVGLSALVAGTGALAVLAEAFGEEAIGLRRTEAVLLLALLAASQGFRSVLDHVGWRLYGVPLPGDAIGRQDAYRQAAAQVVQAGGSPAADADLRRLREDLGLDETTAGVLEKLAEATAAGPLAPGHLVAGRYRVERLLGRGGSGRAFLARDELLDRRVVVKEIPDGADAHAALREARIAGALDSPFVVTVHDVLQRQGAALLVCEYVAGGSLADRVASGGPLPQAEGVALLRDLLEGLAAVHARGVVHRDLKPANVLLTPAGRPKVADFGLARLRTGHTTLADGALVEGTPGYMAPEQRRGERSTAATDVWAAGRVARAAIAHPLPPAVERVVARALAEDPAERWRDASAMLAALRAALDRAAPAQADQ